jgi:16S rRNA (uracil1498-N3)-methyltransferase
MGDFVCALDGSGIEHTVCISQIDPAQVEGEIVNTQPAPGEPRADVSLYVSITQRAKFEWILQKGTELGISMFIPVITSRSLVRETRNDKNKIVRWESILREAAEQCGRGKIPKLSPVMTLTQALSDGKKRNALLLIPWEKETKGDLKDYLSTLNRSQPAMVALLIGPEGGFTDSEAGQAFKSGWIPISLGVRILRMETAALVSAALVLYELGDLRPPIAVAEDS